MQATADVDPISASHDRALPGGTTHARWSNDDLNLSDRAAIVLFARLLKDAGYPGSSSQEALGQQLGSLHRRRDLPLFLRKLEGPDSLKTFAKLFAFQSAVPETEARAAFAPLELERCVEMGILRQHEGNVVSRVNISACDQLLIVHDPAVGDSRQETLPAHVLGVSPPTLVLARLTLREPVRRALDLGTGCGVQALMSAAHCQEVIATDLNPRALTFARFNALLNGITNVEFRYGSLFEPVAGEKFDLIISNPPYVISPESTFLYRDGGRTADGFCENLTRNIPAHLNEQGFACMLCNWAHYSSEEHWSEPVRRWVQGGGCDCWALHGQEHDPMAYAADWNRHRERGAYEKSLQEWTAYYEQLGIRSISSGGIVMRRRDAKNWFRADELGGQMHPLSDSIVRVFRTEDYLALATDEELLDGTFRLQPSHRLLQVMAPGEEDYTVESMRLEVTHHPPFTASMDANALLLLRRCNGRRSLREVLAEVADLAKGDPRACLARGLEIVRGLLAQGVLAPGEKRNNNTTKG